VNENDEFFLCFFHRKEEGVPAEIHTVGLNNKMIIIAT
jgi:hypothetical protein